MDDEEEMKNQCFGGEYMGEVSGPITSFLRFQDIVLRKKIMVIKNDRDNVLS